jgi:hypothetical protein
MHFQMLAHGSMSRSVMCLAETPKMLKCFQCMLFGWLAALPEGPAPKVHVPLPPPACPASPQVMYAQWCSLLECFQKPKLQIATLKTCASVGLLHTKRTRKQLHLAYRELLKHPSYKSGATPHVYACCVEWENLQVAFSQLHRDPYSS